MSKEIVISGRKLVIHEREDVCDPATGRVLTGSWVWDSSVFLANWMANEGALKMELQGKTVLELGAGTGLPGLLAAILGANRVILTDVAVILPALQRNVEANELGGSVEVRELLWGSEDLQSDGEIDLVLMSDVFYDPLEMGALAKTLRGLCGRETRVWGATEVRPVTAACFQVLVEEGFDVVELQGCCGGDSCGLQGDNPVFALLHISPTVVQCT